MNAKSGTYQAPSALDLRAALYDLTLAAEHADAALEEAAKGRGHGPGSRVALAMAQLRRIIPHANGLLRGEQHERTIALCLSTAHIHPGTMENLEVNAQEGGPTWASQHGAFVFVPKPDEEDEHREQDLMAVFAYARQHGYDWVRFDSDGPQVADLPTYEWK